MNNLFNYIINRSAHFIAFCLVSLSFVENEKKRKEFVVVCKWPTIDEPLNVKRSTKRAKIRKNIKVSRQAIEQAHCQPMHILMNSTNDRQFTWFYSLCLFSHQIVYFYAILKIAYFSRRWKLLSEEKTCELRSSDAPPMQKKKTIEFSSFRNLPNKSFQIVNCVEDSPK